MNRITALIEAAKASIDAEGAHPKWLAEVEYKKLANPATILELCALLDKAEDALEKERVSHITTGHTLGVKCQELYLLLMQAQSALEIISRTTSCNYAGVPEALAAIKQWKEKT